jgi:hypothetical protein
MTQQISLIMSFLALAFAPLAVGAEVAPQPPALKPLATPAPQTQPQGAVYPEVAPAPDPAKLGLGIQRTMTLLATSTPAHRPHVRVLFYGQSITEQQWSKQVAADLRARFPNAALEIENRAIGGFASQLLIRPAEHDVYPFYPDLVIFHVFGANQQYDQIIKSIRSRTTAEVLMQNDRVGAKWPQTQPNKEADKGMWWDYLMNHQFLPEIARKYGCALVDIRAGWLAYLRENHYEPSQLLLKDGAHLNVQGNEVMAQLTEQYLIYRPDLPDTEWKDLVHEHPVTEADWKNGRLTMEFDGNRVDLVAQTSGGRGDAVRAEGPVQILVDGKQPSEFPDAYRITRPSPGPWSPLFLSRVDHDAPLVLEDWTLKIKDVAADGKSWAFDVAGSVTGPDGSGRSDQPFVSESKRVKIDPAAWFRGFYPHLPEGYTIRWKVLPMFQEVYPAAKPEDAGVGRAATVIQGIANKKHTLELKAENPAMPFVGVVRVYRPPVPAD